MGAALHLRIVASETENHEPSRLGQVQGVCHGAVYRRSIEMLGTILLIILILMFLGRI